MQRISSTFLQLNHVDQMYPSPVRHKVEFKAAQYATDYRGTSAFLQLNLLTNFDGAADISAMDGNKLAMHQPPTILH